MARGVVAILAFAAACSGTALEDSTTSRPISEPRSSAVTSLVPPATTTTVTTTTASPPTVEEAWSGPQAERFVTDYLAALAAGAFEQAAWSLENNGIVLSGQSDDETASEFLRRSCQDGACAGPYAVEALGPGLIDSQTRQGASKVLVTHGPTGQQATVQLATFEGGLFISGLPPLVPSDQVPSLVELLFGTDVPDHVVVARLDAFEVWTDGTVEWITNWWAEDAAEVEGAWAAVWHQSGPRVVLVSDPGATVDAECPNLMSRDGSPLVLLQCWSDEWTLIDPSTGAELPTPVDAQDLADGEYVTFTERASTVVVATGDAEGNLTEAVTLSGIDVLGDGYAGFDALSVDGAYYAFVDHADPEALSHFWSPVIVVVETATGTEVGRWVLDEIVGCLEFAADWLVACEVTSDPMMSVQVALTAININSGEVRRVETPARVFLPISPAA